MKAKLPSVNFQKTQEKTFFFIKFWKKMEIFVKKSQNKNYHLFIFDKKSVFRHLAVLFNNSIAGVPLFMVIIIV